MTKPTPWTPAKKPKRCTCAEWLGVRGLHGPECNLRRRSPEYGSDSGPSMGEELAQNIWDANEMWEP